MDKVDVFVYKVDHPLSRNLLRACWLQEAGLKSILHNVHLLICLQPTHQNSSSVAERHRSLVPHGLLKKHPTAARRGELGA